VERFVLQRFPDRDDQPQWTTLLDENTLELVDLEVQPGRRYAYRIQAVCKDNVSSAYEYHWTHVDGVSRGSSVCRTSAALLGSVGTLNAEGLRSLGLIFACFLTVYGLMRASVMGVQGTQSRNYRLKRIKKSTSEVVTSAVGESTGQVVNMIPRRSSTSTSSSSPSVDGDHFQRESMFDAAPTASTASLTRAHSSTDPVVRHEPIQPPIPSTFRQVSRSIGAIDEKATACQHCGKCFGLFRKRYMCDICHSVSLCRKCGYQASVDSFANARTGMQMHSLGNRNMSVGGRGMVRRRSSLSMQQQKKLKIRTICRNCCDDLYRYSTHASVRPSYVPAEEICQLTQLIVSFLAIFEEAKTDEIHGAAPLACIAVGKQHVSTSRLQESRQVPAMPRAEHAAAPNSPCCKERFGLWSEEASLIPQLASKRTPETRPSMSDLEGRVFARLAAYNALPEDLREQTAEAQTLLTEKKTEIFTQHHSALVKVPQSARGKELVDFLEKWLKPEEETPAEAKEEVPKAEEAQEEAPKSEEEAPKSEEEAPKEEAAKEEEAPKEEAAKEEEAPKEEVKEEKKKEKKEKKEKKVEEPSPYRVRAKEIAEALVLAGFITSYKDRVKNYQAEAPKEYVTDNELFVPLPETITESKDTTVWNVVDGAIFASQLKRKAGVFSAFTQGKDVYVVANEKTKKIYFFESDVARVVLAEYAADDGFVQFDNAHFQFGVKLVYGEKFELLNLVKKEDQEAFLNSLLNVGVQYREVYNLAVEEAKSFYELKDFDMEKKEVSMEEYKGKVMLVVNVSSKCGLTPTNYPELQQLYTKYKDEGLVVLGFPCNQFKSQEPGTHEEIIEFVKQYEVTFPLFEKHDVNGSNARPIFTYLKAKLPGTFGNYIKWNFTKFLVDRNGQPFKRYAPTDLPLSFEEDIKELLAKEAEPEKTEEETKEEADSAKSDEEATTEKKEEAATTEEKTEKKEESASTSEEVATKEEAVKAEAVAVVAP
ncbi:Phospholipid hydroperoxide glutathione peroxidase, partial [Phytophthora megakarya]